MIRVMPPPPNSAYSCLYTAEEWAEIWAQHDRAIREHERGNRVDLWLHAGLFATMIITLVSLGIHLLGEF